jgi:S1-C subfamily serine protease
MAFNKERSENSMTQRREHLSSAWLTAGLCVLALSFFSRQAKAQQSTGNPPLRSTVKSSASRFNVLAQISRESEALYRQINRSLVTVELDRNTLHLLPKPLRGKFLAWEKNWVVQHDFRANPATGRAGSPEPRIVIKPDLRRGKLSKSPALNRTQRERLGDINDHARAELFLIRHFLFETHPLPPAEFWPEIQLINSRLNSMGRHQGDTIRGLITSPRGLVVVPAIIAPPDDTEPVTVWTAGGKKFTAYILGVKPNVGVTVLRLKGHAAISGLPLIRRPLAAAEMLFAVNATAPSAHWIMPLGQPHSMGPRRSRGRQDQDSGPGIFSIMGGSPAFVFNLRGHLAALNLAKGFFPLNNNRHALRSFFFTGSPQPPRFGIRFKPIKSDSPLRKRIAGLGNKPAMQVIGTFPHSPAAKAGVKKGDIITAIDGASVLNFREIHRHIEANPQNVDLTVLRHGKVIHISMSLHFGHWPRRHHPAPP